LKATEEKAAERLLIEAAQKDPSRFSDLYEQNFERVYAFVARRIGVRDEAEDITAEVFYQALAHLPRFRWRGVPFSAWLFRIAANLIADRWKRAAKEQAISNLNNLTEDDVEEAQERALLFRLVGTLPPAQRRVIVMRFAEQRSIREVAQELGRTEGAVKQLQLRALENLRKRMGETNG